MHRWWFDVDTRHPSSTVRRGRIECVIGQVYSILYAINMIIDIPLEIYKLNANVRFLAKPHAPHLPHAGTQRTACTTDELCSALKRKLNVLSSTLAIINKSIMCKCIQIYIYLFRTKRAPLVAVETAHEKHKYSVLYVLSHAVGKLWPSPSQILSDKFELSLCCWPCTTKPMNTDEHTHSHIRNGAADEHFVSS